MSGFSIKAVVVSGLVGLASVLAAGASAQAASPVVAGVISHGASSPVAQVNHRPGHYSRPPVHHSNRHACTPRQAAARASRMGIRNTRTTTTRSTIRVSGFQHGRHVTVIFGKARGCPILR